MENKFLRKIRTKIAPTNNEYNQIINIGYFKGIQSQIFSCFIGNCRFKTYTFDKFSNHIKNFHQNDISVKKDNLCSLCDKFECKNSLKEELKHMMKHIQGLEIEKPKTALKILSISSLSESEHESTLDDTILNNNNFEVIKKTKNLQKLKEATLKILSVSSLSESEQESETSRTLDDIISVNNHSDKSFIIENEVARKLFEKKIENLKFEVESPTKSLAEETVKILNDSDEIIFIDDDLDKTLTNCDIETEKLTNSFKIPVAPKSTLPSKTMEVKESNLLKIMTVSSENIQITSSLEETVVVNNENDDQTILVNNDHTILVTNDLEQTVLVNNNLDETVKIIDNDVNIEPIEEVFKMPAPPSTNPKKIELKPTSLVKPIQSQPAVLTNNEIKQNSIEFHKKYQHKITEIIQDLPTTKNVKDKPKSSTMKTDSKVTKNIQFKPTARKSTCTKSAIKTTNFQPIALTSKPIVTLTEIKLEPESFDYRNCNDDTVSTISPVFDRTLEFQDCISSTIIESNQKEDELSEKFKTQENIFRISKENEFFKIPNNLKRFRNSNDEMSNSPPAKIKKLDQTETNNNKGMIDQYFDKLPKPAIVDEEQHRNFPSENVKNSTQMKPIVEKETSLNSPANKLPENEQHKVIKSLPSLQNQQIKASNSPSSQKSMRDLYPWIDEKISRAVLKSRKSIKTLMSTLCLFSTYKCMRSSCSFFTTDFNDFKKHLTEHKSNSSQYCSFCLKNFTKPAELCNHIDVFHRHDRFQCSHCMYRSCQKSYVFEHQKIFHEKKNCEVLISPVQILLKSTLIREEKGMEKNREMFVPAYCCKIANCKKIFYSKQNFKKHLEAKIAKPDFANFGETICQQLAEIDHRRTFNNIEGLTQCLFCNFGTDDDDIIEHLSLKHQSQFSFVCKRTTMDHLKEVSFNKETLETHTKIEFIGNHPGKFKVFNGYLELLKSK